MPHTEGPWGYFPEFDPELDDPKYIVDVPAERAPHRLSDSPWSYIEVAVVPNQTSNENGNETECNAALIAAAPELLASLEKIIDFAEGAFADRGGIVAEDRDFSAARAAIAKARPQGPRGVAQGVAL